MSAHAARDHEPSFSDDISLEVPGSDEAGPSAPRIVVGYGFWIFLISDIVMFSALFAAYAVLSAYTAGGPSGRELFDLDNVAIETLCLLFSSYTCGMATLALARQRMPLFYAMAAATGALGAVFLGYEIAEFAGMVAKGAGPDRSAFLSAFFSLVGLHGIHVSAGLIWLVFMVAHFAVKGPREFILRRFYCFGLFWHALDIIWVALLTLVYLMGTRA